MKKLFVLLVIACMAMITIPSTASGKSNQQNTIQQQTIGSAIAIDNPGDPIVKSNSKSPIKGGITSGGVQSNSKSSLKTNYKSNNQFQKPKYTKILRIYNRKKFWNKIF
jgi:hypothetical protein